MLTIRKAEYKDYKTLVPLYQQLTSIDPDIVTYDIYKMFLDTLHEYHQVFVVCDNDDNVIGATTILIETKLIHNLGRVGHIEDVVVNKNVRGGGIGKMIVQYATIYAKEKGCYKVILDCSDDNVPFYEKNGYIKKGNEMAIYF